MAFNFPDTDGALTDGSFVHTEGDLVYAWNGQTWDLIADNSNNSGDVGEGITQDQADLRYVQQSGDNMTGDLTLGIDKIILDQDTGSGTYEGSLQSATLTDGSLTKTMTEVLTLVTTGGPVNTLQQVTDAGDTTTNGATFVGRVDSETGFKSTGSYGFNSFSDSTGPVFSVNNAAGSDPKVVINGDGSATFAGGNTTFNANGSWQTHRDIGGNDVWITGCAGATNGRKGLFVGPTDDVNNSTVQLGVDGSAVFAGTVTSSGTFATTSSITIDNPTNTTSDIVFSVQTGTLQQSKFRIKADGTTQIGNIDTGADTANITLSSTGEIDTVDIIQVNQVAASNSASMFLARNGLNTEDTDYKFIVKGQGVFIGENVDRTTNAGANIELAADGTADFAGDVTAGGEPTGGVEEGASLRSIGALRACRAAGGNPLFAGYLQGAANPTSRIYAGGSAEFADKIDVGGGVNNGEGVTLRPTGLISHRLDGGTQNAYNLYADGTTVDDIVIQFKSDGSASFSGAATSGPGDPYAGANNAASLTDGTVVATRENDQSIWVGFNKGDSNATSQIRADGSATFTNQVSVGSLVLDGGDALTDYEEGTWTPTFTDITFLPGQTSNYNVFTRVGRLVHLTMRLPVQSSSTGGSISLPFTAVSATAAGTGTITDTSTGIAEGESIPLSVNGTGGVTAKIAAFTLTGNQTLDISLTYTTA